MSIPKKTKKNIAHRLPPHIWRHVVGKRPICIRCSIRQSTNDIQIHYIITHRLQSCSVTRSRKPIQCACALKIVRRVRARYSAAHLRSAHVRPRPAGPFINSTSRCSSHAHRRKTRGTRFFYACSTHTRRNACGTINTRARALPMLVSFTIIIIHDFTGVYVCHSLVLVGVCLGVDVRRAHRLVHYSYCIQLETAAIKRTFATYYNLRHNL